MVTHQTSLCCEASQDQRSEQRRGLLGVFEVVREEQRIHVWNHHEEGRAQRLVERGLSLELAGLPPALQDLRERSLELLLEGRHERPAIASGNHGNVVELAVR